MDENDKRLANEVRELIAASRGLADVNASDFDEPGLVALALGSVVLGRELALGVVDEAMCEPHRGLNALRLARHPLELEHELHYAHEDPTNRVVQFQRREAVTRTWVPRYYPAFKSASIDEATKHLITKMADEGTRLNGEAAARVEGGDEVGASEWGTVPDRKRIAKYLDRLKEYRAHYEPASWLSHPSIGALENVLDLSDEGTIVDRPSGLAVTLPGMARSLARMAYARVLRRAFEILELTERAGEISEFMRLRGIGETGVVEADPRSS